MYIEISANKLKFNNVLSGEELLIKIESIQSIDDNTLKVNMSHHVLAVFEQKPRPNIQGTISLMPKSLEFTTDSHFFTVAVKLVYDWMVNNLLLSDSDIDIVASVDYIADKGVRPIRLTLPFDVILKTEAYRNLVGSMLDLSVPNEQVNDYYSLYLEEIFTDDRTILEADIRVLIEE